MSNSTEALRGRCPEPFFQSSNFPSDAGFLHGRICQEILPSVECCLPCHITEWVYPDSFYTLSRVADWVNVVGMISCIFLLLSYAFLPVGKTNRHYLSISLCVAVTLMTLGFIIPLAAQPDPCLNEITPDGMQSSSTCAASGAFLLFGGFSGAMWVFLRSLSLHLQICWQLTVGSKFMWWAQGVGWGVPMIIVIITMMITGVSFRFGRTCHINHDNSLAAFWIPLLIVAGLTVIISFTTFGYCIKVYLASLADDGPSTQGSSLPSYPNSVLTLNPRQAYRRVRRVIALQWRGMTIVLIIIADVIFFSIVFVFQDNTLNELQEDPSIAAEWTACLTRTAGDKNECLEEAQGVVIPMATVFAVLLLLALNGIWLLLFLGRWSMAAGWIELARSIRSKRKNEFVSVDARMDYPGKSSRSYEMLSRNLGKTMESVVTSEQGSPPRSDMRSPTSASNGSRTPDYLAHAPAPTVRYKAPAQSFATPQAPQSRADYQSPSSPQGRSNEQDSQGYENMNPLAMNRI